MGFFEIGEDLMRERVTEVLFKGNDEGKCVNCGGPRPESAFAFCRSCAHGIMSAMVERYGFDEVVRLADIADKVVKDDIKKSIIEGN